MSITIVLLILFGILVLGPALIFLTAGFKITNTIEEGFGTLEKSNRSHPLN